MQALLKNLKPLQQNHIRAPRVDHRDGAISGCVRLVVTQI